MPFYQYECAKCEHRRGDVRTVAERHDGPTCDVCKAQMKLVVTPVAGIVKNPAVPRSRR